jgi:hypothetical protein
MAGLAERQFAQHAQRVLVDVDDRLERLPLVLGGLAVLDDQPHRADVKSGILRACVDQRDVVDDDLLLLFPALDLADVALKLLLAIRGERAAVVPDLRFRDFLPTLIFPCVGSCGAWG